MNLVQKKQPASFLQCFDRFECCLILGFRVCWGVSDPLRAPRSEMQGFLGSDGAICAVIALVHCSLKSDGNLTYPSDFFADRTDMLGDGES
jgi:hypothetical protein